MKYILLVTATALMLVMTTYALGSEVILLPDEDVYVDSANPSTCFGGAADLYLGKGTYWGLGFFRVYLKFDVSGLMGACIGEAKIWLYQYTTAAAAGGLPCDAHRVTSGWDEYTITWNTKPSHSGTILDSKDVGDSFYSGWIKWDITPLVIGWLDGTYANQGVVLKHYYEITAGASRYGIFYATESAQDEREPRLVIQTTGTSSVETTSPTSWGRVKAMYR